MLTKGKKIYNVLRRFVIYTLILGVLFTLAINSKSTTVKVILIVIFIVSLVIILVLEYYKYLFNKSIDSLNDDCDPEKGKQYFDKLMKLDRFNLYGKNKFAFDILYNLSINNPKECIHIINKEAKYFSSSINNILIKNTTLMIVYLLTENKNMVKKAYKEILEIKNDKAKFIKASSSFNWDELEAMYMLSNEKYNKSVKIFKSVNTNNMNNREKTQYYYFYSLALINSNKSKNAKEMLNQCIEIGNKTTFAKSAKKLLANI
ncbi:MAG: hypothetical protein GX675_02390 [Erysipelotrichaceae bacterium]|nr:hypothetical protein [Erysipelotrichaceae bacterium]